MTKELKPESCLSTSPDAGLARVLGSSLLRLQQLLCLILTADSSAPLKRRVGAQERRCTWNFGWCPPLPWVTSVGFVGCAPPASWMKAGTAGLAALVPSPGQEWEGTSEGKRILLVSCLNVFCQKSSVPYPLHRTVSLHHLEPRGWSFFWMKLKVLGR